MLYKYIRENVVAVSVKLHNIVNHDQLKTKGVFDERPVREEADYSDVVNMIKGSTILLDIDYADIEDWVHDFYNNVIASVLLIDDIHIESIEDKGNYLICELIGTQYRDVLSIINLNTIRDKLEQLMAMNNSNLIDLAYFNSSELYPDDAEAYDIQLYFTIPLEEVEI